MKQTTMHPLRDADILQRRLAGETFKHIAAAHGMTVDEVKKVIASTTKQTQHNARQADMRIRARQERERERLQRQVEAEARRRRYDHDKIQRMVGQLAADWRALNNFGVYLQERERITNGFTDFGSIERIMDAWIEGRANETATVRRLQRLMDENIVPEGLAA